MKTPGTTTLIPLIAILLVTKHLVPGVFSILSTGETKQLYWLINDGLNALSCGILLFFCLNHLPRVSVWQKIGYATTGFCAFLLLIDSFDRLVMRSQMPSSVDFVAIVLYLIYAVWILWKGSGKD